MKKVLGLLAIVGFVACNNADKEAAEKAAADSVAAAAKADSMMKVAKADSLAKVAADTTKKMVDTAASKMTPAPAAKK